LRSFHNPKVKRHYTVASCMKKDAYDQYIGLINQFKNDPNGRFKFNDAVLPET